MIMTQSNQCLSERSQRSFCCEVVDGMMRGWQAFHILYHTDHNVLLGAPTGSGKTISAELAMLHLFNTKPDMKVRFWTRAE